MGDQKILIVSRTFFPKEGGIEEYVFNRALQDPDQVMVLAAAYPGDEEFDAQQDFPVYRWFSPGVLYRNKVGSLFRQILNIILSFVVTVRLYFTHRYEAIEWAHGYDFISLLIITYLLPVKCSMYLHGNDLLCPLKNLAFRYFFQLTLQRLDSIVCNSSFTRDYLQKHFFVDTPIFVINPTVRPQKFGIQCAEDINKDSRSKTRQQYGIPEEALVILSVGRLVPRKGFERIIAVLPQLLKAGVDVHYLICGRGAMENELRFRTQELEVQNRVHFAGYVSDQELGDYYLCCDIFAMITFFDAKDASIEGFGIVYREASFFGKPVIAARVGGVLDAIQHEENGLLVNPDCPEEIIKAFLRLCRDSQLRKQLGVMGQKLAQQRPNYAVLYGS